MTPRPFWKERKSHWHFPQYPPPAAPMIPEHRRQKTRHSLQFPAQCPVLASPPHNPLSPRPGTLPRVTAPEKRRPALAKHMLTVSVCLHEPLLGSSLWIPEGEPMAQGGKATCLRPHSSDPSGAYSPDGLGLNMNVNKFPCDSTLPHAPGVIGLSRAGAWPHPSPQPFTPRHHPTHSRRSTNARWTELKHPPAGHPESR